LIISNNAGRLNEIQQNGQSLAQYNYNSQGQRTQKTTPSNTTVYHYDLEGNLISESQADGTPTKDYLWHNGNPIAQLNIGATDVISYLHSDHLQTARLATDQNQQIIWQWEGNAFGDTPAQELAGLQINLRFPGQYVDAETNLHYNWNRYYNPATGRYITSDPIGLGGGLNTYGYVGGNPLNKVDPKGLCGIGQVTKWDWRRGFYCELVSDPYPNCSYDDYNCRAGLVPDDKEKGECIVKCVLIGTAETEVGARTLIEAAKRTGKEALKVVVRKAAQIITGPIGAIWTVYSCEKKCSECSGNQ
jgi:RHS repeat-associated protein